MFFNLAFSFVYELFHLWPDHQTTKWEPLYRKIHPGYSSAFKFPGKTLTP